MSALLTPAAERLAQQAEVGDARIIRDAASALPTIGVAKVGYLADFLAVLETSRPKANSNKDLNSKLTSDRLLMKPLTQAFHLPPDRQTWLKRSTLEAIASELMSMPFNSLT